MEPEDLEPRAKKPALRNLEIMSIEALRVYIGELEAEIARARAEIAAKETARDSAAGLFRT
ncbi:MAG: DUF1192 family protein [Rhodospirillales bacterium]|nr:MAG: DUF1192 family protein [Rhodospirillales bacterium]